MEIDQAARWEEEALRLCERYLREVVLAFGLCPWAEPAWRAGRVARGVCLAADPAAADCLPFLARWAEATVDVGFLLFPRQRGGWSAFDSFAERVRRAERERQSRTVAVAAGGSATPGTIKTPGQSADTFMVAAFHPQGAESFVGPHQLISYLRRTPDPTLQFVRADLLDRLKRNQPDVSEAVGRHNHQTVLQHDTQSRLDQAIRDLAADREATYAALRGTS